MNQQEQQSNFHQNLSNHFGRKALELFCAVERCTIKNAKWRNTLHFNLSCKRFKICPKSLKLSSNVKDPRADKILSTAEMALLALRISQTVATLSNITKDRQEAEVQLEQHVDATTFGCCKSRFEASYTHHYDKTRNKQKAKFEKLRATHAEPKDKQLKPIASVSKEREREVKEKWVYNTSSKTLTEPQNNVLEKGLAFTPTPSKAPTLDLIVAVESGARQLGLQSDAASSLRAAAAKVLSKPKTPPANITRDERQAIKDLKNDSSISIHPADKGRATVIMDKDDYMEKMERHVSDNTTYGPLPADPTKQYRDTIMATLLPMKSHHPLFIAFLHQRQPTLHFSLVSLRCIRLVCLSAPLSPAVAPSSRL